MKYNGRLMRIEQETKPERVIFKIEYCTHAQADALEAQRPPGRPGEVRYIIVPPEHVNTGRDDDET